MKITKIRKLEYATLTADIEVADTHSYQLDNGWVVHNTVSQLVDAASGIHARHSPYYVRTVRADVKDTEDMTVIGPVLEKQQKIINDVVEKKLTLAKLQSTIWEKSNKVEDDLSLGDIDDEMLQSLISKDIENINDKPYKLK